MKRKQLLEFNKRIVLDEERMQELNRILAEYCDKTRYRGETVDHQSIEFDSFEELISYPNYGKERLNELWTCGEIGNDWMAIDLRLSNNSFSKPAVCNYKFSDDAKFYHFGKKLRDLLNKSSEYFKSYIICKVFTHITILAAPLLALIKYINNQQRHDPSAVLAVVSSALILAFIGFGVNKIIWDRVFPKVTFAWGEEKRRYTKKAKLLSNLFWGVIVAAVISIGCSAIFAG